MIETVKKYIEKYHMLAENDYVIAGVSGGADSMCLLLVLEELRKQMDFHLSVVHINHMLRGEAADADENYVSEVCAEKEIPFEVFRVDVARLAKERKLSLEEAGRAARREAFATAAERALRGEASADVAERVMRGEGFEAAAERAMRGEASASVPECVMRGEVSADAAERAAGKETFASVPERAVRKRMTASGDGRVRIALAHHREDNAETFLMNLARGSRLKGLGGISPVNGEFIRPLLCVGRGEIEKFLEEKKVSYCMDATNLEDTYTRNRIRRNILPALKDQVNSRAVEHIDGAIGQLREVWQYLEKQTEEAYRRCIKSEERPSRLYRDALEDPAAVYSGDSMGHRHKVLVKERFDELDHLIQSMVLYRLLEEVACQAKDIEECHVSALRGLMDKQVGRQLSLPYGMCARRCYDGIELWRETGKSKFRQLEQNEAGDDRVARKNEAEESQSEDSLRADIRPGEIREYRFKDRTISMRVFPRPAGELDIPKKTFTKWFDYGIIEQGLSIRTRRAGDQIVFDSRGNTQKLKKLLINEKVPAQLRDEILLAADGSRILWVVGIRQSKAYQVTEYTKDILEITVR